jgi:hypothetical protein
MSSRGSRRAQERIAKMRAEQERRHRRRRLLVIMAATIVAGGAAAGIAVAATTSGGGAVPPGNLAPLSTLGSLHPAPPAGPAGPEGVPIPAGTPLAGTSPQTTGQTIDGISCGTSEQTLFHIHAHLTIFVNGIAKQVPARIGIPGGVEQQGFVVSGNCYYWLHTHAADGIIHIESPVQRTYTLGDFFDEWGQPLSSSRVGPATGHVTAIYNGQVFRGNPRDIPLTRHAQIQLEVGTPLVAPEQIIFPSGL